jgi:hypothetical protein
MIMKSHDFDQGTYDDCRTRLIGDLMQAIGFIACNVPHSVDDPAYEVMRSGRSGRTCTVDSVPTKCLSDLLCNIRVSYGRFCEVLGVDGFHGFSDEQGAYHRLASRPDRNGETL